MAHTHIKECRNCWHIVAPRKRKCPNCGGNTFKPATAEQVKAHEETRERRERLLESLLERTGQ